ncbi:MAG: adenine deaminase [Clostridia bacterium]|nr:adenine deaminase [Clostridia bacterium]
MKAIIDAAMGRTLCDLALKNCKVVDVFGKSIIEGDIGILGERIVGVGKYGGKTEVDLQGQYVMPGFVDSHVHIESSMVSPAEYAKAVMPKGVTTIIADPHEIANVCGEDGLSYMKESAKDVPLDILYMLPSCVPATPFEHTGASLDAEKVKKLLPDFLGLGEMMNYVGVIGADDEVLLKLACEHIDGHAPLLSGNKLNAYISAGIKTDHECTCREELAEKISKGMYVQLREGTLSRDLVNLLSGVNEGNSRRCLFCSDDRYIGEIKSEGTINYCIIKAVEHGLDVFEAIRMASLNAAECYGLKETGAIAPGYFADLVVSRKLLPEDITAVYKRGALVAQNGTAAFEIQSHADTGKVTHTVHLPKIDEKFFQYTPKKGKITAIQINKDTIVTTKVTVDSILDLSKVCVIERHHNTGNKGIGFVSNYKIKNGAISSTIGHDSHNAIVIGDNDRDMALAINTLDDSGGICVCSKGKVLAHLPLPIAGLMSDLDADDVISLHEQLDKAARDLGVNPDINPFLALAFLPLPVIPQIRITDRGLFDVEKFEFID